MLNLIHLAMAAGMQGPIEPSSSPFCWTFISPNANGTMQTAEPWTGVRSLYVGVGGYSPGGGGYNRFEFSFSGSLTVLDLIPMNGAVNQGTVTAPSIVLPTCELVFPPVVAEIRVLDNTGLGGTLCFTDSQDTDRNCGFYCHDLPELQVWLTSMYSGFSSDGSVPCQGTATSDGCQMPVSVEAHSWGRIKSVYRQ